MYHNLERVSPEALYDAVWTSARENFYAQSRLDGWQFWRHRFDGMLHSYGDAHAAIGEMLSSLQDKYTFLKLPEVLERDEAVATNEMSPVRVAFLRGGIGYIRLFTFGQQNTADAMRNALVSLDGACGIILDLRGNPGGFLRQANDMLSLFMSVGAAMVLRNCEVGGITEEINVLHPCGYEATKYDSRGHVLSRMNWARYPNLLGGRPLYVLIDERTCSASELVAATLRDHRIALLIGRTTAGKGIAQDNMPLPNGCALRCTNGVFLPPSRQWFGDDAQTVSNGVEPHVWVDRKRWHLGDCVFEVAVERMARECRMWRPRAA